MGEEQPSPLLSAGSLVMCTPSSCLLSVIFPANHFPHHMHFLQYADSNSFLCICFNRLSWWEPIREADVKWQQYEEGWLGQADIGNSQRGIWAIQRWIIKEPNNTGVNNIDVNTLNSWILLRWIIKELNNMGLNDMDVNSFLKLNN